MTATTAADEPPARAPRMSAEEKRVIFASSLGTVFEWYDFYLFGVLTGVIGAQFFAPLDEATRNIFTLLAFAAVSRCARSVRSCSGGSETWSAASTPF
jgi:hypothetical protein